MLTAMNMTATGNEDNIKDMVNRNNGTISVDSTRGVGSKFILNFPKS